MGMMQVPFIASANKSRSTVLDAQQCINFFSEAAPGKDAESPVGIFGCPGLKLFASLGTGPVRGFHIVDDLLYAVSGTALYTITKTGLVTQVSGAVPITGENIVQMADNGIQVCIVNGVSGWIYTIPNSSTAAAFVEIPQNTTTDLTTSTDTASGSTMVNVVLSTGAAVGGSLTGGGLAVGTTITALAGNLLTISPATVSDTPSGSTLVCVTEGTNAFYPANTVTFMDGYFIFDRAGTNQFFFSGLYNGLTYNGLDYGTKEGNSDFLQCVINLHELLILVGERTTEMWYDSGANTVPFAPYTSSTIERGTPAPQSVILEDNCIFFLGDDLIFYRLNAYLPIRISTHVEEAAWAQYGTYSDVFSFVSIWEGHKFIVVTFPSAQATWVFDIATELWHQRESWDQNNETMGRWRGNCGVQYFGQTLIGDSVNGNVGVWDYDTYTEYGNTIRGLLTSPPIHKNRQRIFMSGFELYMESGVGLSGAGAPEVFLDWSDDGGRTWSALKRPASFGAQGNYQQRTRWLRLGQSRTRTLRLTVTDPVRRNIVGAYLSLTSGET